MEVKWRYRGRDVTEEDLASIRSLIAEHPGHSRWALSKLLCERWNWRQDNGELRDMIARSLMLGLDRAGLIELPAARSSPPNNVILRRRPERVSLDRTPIRAALSSIGPVDIREVRRTSEERIFDGLIEEHHYLRYTRPVGEHLKYMAFAGERPVACIAWSSAPRHLGPRDRFIGWSKEARRRNLHLLAYNPRYLILPWVEVPHLASHLLGRMARRLARDWERVYGHPVHFLETFTDPARFRGTCYRAANWVSVGLTTGRGKADFTKKPNRPLKEILVYPLTRHFRELLGRLP